MYGFSGGHLIIVAIVVLLFGSRKLPELGSSLGKGMKAFKDAVEGRAESETLPVEKQIHDKSSNNLVEGRQKS